MAFGFDIFHDPLDFYLMSFFCLFMDLFVLSVCDCLSVICLAYKIGGQQGFDLGFVFLFV